MYEGHCITHIMYLSGFMQVFSKERPFRCFNEIGSNMRVSFLVVHCQSSKATWVASLNILILWPCYLCPFFFFFLHFFFNLLALLVEKKKRLNPPYFPTYCVNDTILVYNSSLPLISLLHNKINLGLTHVVETPAERKQ